MTKIKQLLLPVLFLLGLAGSASAVQLADFPKAGSQYSRLIVVFKRGVLPAYHKTIALNLAKDGGVDVLHELPIINAVVIAVPKGKKLQAPPEVEKIEEDIYRENWIDAPAAIKGATKEAAFFEDLRNISIQPANPNLGAPVQSELTWGVLRVNAPGAWAKGATGKGVKVAVVDTGIDYTHPDLAPNVAAEKGFNATNPETPPMDDHGHGTHVAGTIAAAKSAKYPGVAPEATLYAVKVLNAQGGGYLTDIIAGLQWTAGNGIQVVNMSLGADTDQRIPFFENAITKTAQAGVALVVAAGNSGAPKNPKKGNVAIPARYPECIAISALKPATANTPETIATFSSRGPEIEYIAPGEEIWSTWPNGEYKQARGTSMATPHAAGLAALAISANPGTVGTDAVRLLLKPAASKVQGLTPSDQGSGVVNAALLVR